MEGEALERLFDLKGRVALVTGGTSDIGRAVALALACHGAEVAVTSRQPGRLENLVGEIQQLGRKASALFLDLEQVESICQAVKEATKKHGRIDILVNNAAATLRKPALETSLEEWDQIIRTNLTGVFLLCQEAARVMVDQGGGKIINIASTHGILPYPGRVAYSVSKAALSHLTRALALEWARYRINVNAVAPAITRTSGREAVLRDPETYRDLVSRIPMGRIATPDDIAGAVVYLASPASDFVTGHVLIVDGGRTLT